MTRLANQDLVRSLSGPLLVRPVALCAYCRRELTPGDPRTPTSHGCCKSCETWLLAEEQPGSI